MDTKSKILISFILLAIIISVSATFYKTVILQDFEVIDSNEENNQSDE